ncbi:MAG: hypothetical protein WCJ51_03540 [Candidatus Moraniibacteriota bacterium]
MQTDYISILSPNNRQFKPAKIFPNFPKQAKKNEFDAETTALYN